MTRRTPVQILGAALAAVLTLAPCRELAAQFDIEPEEAPQPGLNNGPAGGAPFGLDAGQAAFVSDFFGGVTLTRWPKEPTRDNAGRAIARKLGEKIRLRAWCRTKGGLYLFTDHGIFYVEEIEVWGRQSDYVVQTVSPKSSIDVLDCTEVARLATDNFNAYVSTGTGGGDVFTLATLPVGGSQGKPIAAKVVGDSLGAAARADLASPVVALLIGTGGAGVFRSADSGHTFTAVSGLPSGNLYGWVFVQSGTSVFVGTNQGVYKSLDYGATWAPASGGLPGTAPNVTAMAASGTALFAGVAGSGIYRSTDNGGSWQPTTYSPKPDTYSKLAGTPNGIVFAGTSAGLFVTADGGATWAPFDLGRAETNVSSLLPWGPTIVAGISNAVPNGLFVTPDHGSSWTPGGVLPGITGLVASGSALVATGYSGIYRSTDGGATFTQAPSFPRVLGGSAPAIASSGGSLFASNWTDLYRSVDNGTTWAKFNGTLNRNVSSFGITSFGSTGTALLLGAGSFGQGVVRSLDGGNTWSNVPGFQAFDTILAFAASASTVWAGNLGTPRLYRSTDGGATFAPVAAAGIDGSVWSLAAGPDWLLAGTNSGLSISSDGGATFSAYDARVPGIVQSLAIVGDRLYAATSANGVWVLPAPGKASRFVPVVLDVISGTAHFTTELSLTNRGTKAAAVSIFYSASLGSGTGTVNDTLPAGKQLVIPDVIAYLRQKGLSIPTSGPQVGTLLVRFDGVSAPNVVAGVARTTSVTEAPQPAGSAGLAYTAIDPVADASTAPLWVYGLRQNATDRSNLAVYNPGSDPVTVKVTAFSGDGQSSVIAAAEVLPAYGWKQYNGVMAGVGNGTGYASVERVSSTGAFGTYGVINDNGTNDGSWVLPVSVTSESSYLNVSTLVETPTFVTELVLSNRRTVATTFALTYAESLNPSGGAGGTVNVTLQAGEQRIIPGAIAFLRQSGAALGPAGQAYAGFLRVVVPGPLVSDVFAGARTASPSPAGGQFGLFYGGDTPGFEALGQAWIYGLRSDSNNRSNVAILNVAPPGTASVTLSLQAYDGDGAGAAAGSAESKTLAPGGWFQFNNFLATKGISNGWVKVTSTAGTAPWIAYGVINDGGQPGQRTGDGAFIPMVK